MTLSQIRYQQQYQQLSSRLPAGNGTIVTYASRDADTGLRVVKSADGGQQLITYLSNSAPEGVMASFSDAPIGLPGYVAQRSR